MNYKHGEAKKGKVSPTYTCWLNMKVRCNDVEAVNYDRYGGRGISYDPSWEIFINFLADMGERPEGLTLERINNDKGYSKENCKWATLQEQALNKRTYSSNKSGRKGVNWRGSRGKWEASGSFNGHQKYLYQGPSFEEACAAREAWEKSTGLNHGN